MYKRFALVLAIILLSITLTGCWGKRELNEIGIVTVTGIDSETDGSTRISVLSIVPTGGSGGKGGIASNTWLGTATGPTIYDAILNLNKVATRKLTWLHNKVLLIGEKKARSGISDVIDYFSSSRQVRLNSNILLAKGQAYETMQIPSGLEKNLYSEISNMIDNQSQWSGTYVSDLRTLTQTTASDTAGSITGNLSYFMTENEFFSVNREEMEKFTNVHQALPVGFIEGVGVFKKDKLVGWMDAVETKGYMWIKGKIKTASISSNYKNVPNSLTVQVKKAKSTIEPRLINGNLSINIKVHTQFNQENVTIQADLTNKETISKMNKSISDSITNQIQDTVNKAQKDFNSDIFGFGESIFRKYPSYWKSIEKNWDSIFPHIPVTYDVKAETVHTGITSQSQSNKSKNQD